MSDELRQRARQLAERFHHHYETLAPAYGYQSRFVGKSFDEIPDNNRELMIQVCMTVLAESAGSPPAGEPRAFTLMCKCGSEFKPTCPDCHELYDAGAAHPVNNVEPAEQPPQCPVSAWGFSENLPVLPKAWPADAAPAPDKRPALEVHYSGGGNPPKCKAHEVAGCSECAEVERLTQERGEMSKTITMLKDNLKGHLVSAEQLDWQRLRAESAEAEVERLTQLNDTFQQNIITLSGQVKGLEERERKPREALTESLEMLDSNEILSEKIYDIVRNARIVMRRALAEEPQSTGEPKVKENEK